MFVKPRLTALFAALALAGCAANQDRVATAEPIAKPPAGPPKLIIAIAVDQFSSDLFAEYRQTFTGGLARLQKGMVFPSGYQSHAATETCPGHSTLLTGVRPARNGIVANWWVEPGIERAEKRVYCSEDTRDPASSSNNPVVSARSLKVPTLGEFMKAAAPTTRNVAVSGKDRAVMMMGGHKIDAGYWWKGEGFTSFAGVTPSSAALAANAAIAAEVKAGAPALAVPAWCAARDRAVTVGKGTVGTNRFAVEPGKLAAWRGSPRVDGAIADLAIRLSDEMQLGQQNQPDILSVSFSTTDTIGHAWGTEGLEMCLQMAALDAAIGRLLAHFDAQGIDYAVVLSADHGGLDTQERLVEQGFPRAVRIDESIELDAVKVAVGKATGIKLEGPLLYAEGGDYYVNRAVSAADKPRVIEALVRHLRNNAQVAAVFTAQELTRTPLPTGNPQDWSLKDRARASFDPERSGDVLMLLDRAVVPIRQPAPGSYIATHGSPWDYDRRVPIMFWRRGMTGFEQPAPVETIDIAPSLAALLGLRLPEGTFDGRCLDLDAGAGNSCEGPK